MILSIIAAIGKKNELGYNNDLLWHIPADLKRFKEITTGHPVIMGRRTFNSINNKALPNRRNIVISTKEKLDFKGIEHARSIEEAIKFVNGENEVFILGGATIYEQFLPFTDKMYLTFVHRTYNADTFFPDYKSDEWIESERIDVRDDSKAGVDYSFVLLNRKK